jgi:hypothetical protein
MSNDPNDWRAWQQIIVFMATGCKGPLHGGDSRSGPRG